MTPTAELWPTYTGPDELAEIESAPLADRGLPATTYDILVRAATTWPDKCAVQVLPNAERWQSAIASTFSGLLADVHQVANVLRSHGVERRDVVTLLSPNCADLLPTMIGAQLAGVVAPVNLALSVEHVADLLGRNGSRVAVVAGPELDEGAWSTGQELASRGLLDVLLVLRPTPTPGQEPEPPVITAVGAAEVCYLREAMSEMDAESFSGAPPEADDVASVFHTGGTTGTPKLAAHLHRNEVSDAWMVATSGELDEDSVAFAGLPLFHVNALVVTLLAPMFRGQTVVWAGPLGYREPTLYANFWKVVEHYRISAMSAVPTVYAVLAACPVDAEISSLTFALVGASPLPAAVRQAFEQHTGVPLVEGYGLTEGTCVSARSFPAYPRDGSVGQRLPYQSIRIVRIDEDGHWTDLSVGEVGVVAISGPNVFPGYISGRDGSEFVLDPGGKVVDGWLDTGDLGRVDADGFLYLTGRAKDLIIRGGHNIDPQVIEDALLAHPGVTGAGAVGRPDRHAGEVPVAYVTLAAGSTATDDELARWARDHVGEASAAPKQVMVLDALPVTDVGKPYKLELRRLATMTQIATDLQDLQGVDGVDTRIVDGSIEVTVVVAHDGLTTRIEEAMSGYSLTYRIETAP